MPLDVKPGEPAPELVLDLVDGGQLDLAARRPRSFTMVVFYRGLHCPVCRSQLRQIQRMLDDFGELGVEVVAVSMDNERRASRAVQKWELDRLPVAYGLTEAAARRWGLFISSAIKEGEPEVFSEPALFLVRPDGTLYSGYITTNPYGRPDLPRLLKGIEWMIENDYPPRGTAT
jgi:peroxiredoxin